VEDVAMTTRFRRLAAVPLLTVLAAAGCHCCAKKRDNCNTCPPLPPPGAQIVTPAPAGPGVGIGVPPGSTILPPAAPPPGVPAAPAPSFPSGSGFPPVASFYGAPNGVRLGVPEGVVQAQAQAPAPPAQRPAGPTPGVRLLPPEFGSGSAAAPATTTPTAPTTPVPAATPSLPVGIADFAPALDRVAGGRKPTLDGLDWLKANGYRTAVQLRRPGESDAADRKQVEARGLAFRSLEVSPATLSWATVEAFAQLVGDPTSQPLFVYDADGSLSGGLWYLYFRRVERLPDEAARVRAARLGLKESADGPQREMWLAVQALLARGG
jgi:protein tyrosine phosphatase (PTP) superfamily phosphohydrolase (DUF442 family)